MVHQIKLEEPRPCDPQSRLCFNVHTAAGYVNRNVSIGQLLQYISKSIAVCTQSMSKILTKTCKKEILSGFIIVALYNYTYSKHWLMPV